jgi:hypothetical protein
MSFRKVFSVLIVAVLTLGVAWAHCLLYSRQHLASGDAAAAAGDAETARLEWETAASRPAPLNGYAREAMARLVALEETLERQGRTAEALRVCFSVRGIANASAGLWPWYRAERDLASGRIEALSRDRGVRFGPDRFTLFRPVRTWPAFGALASFAGFVWLALKAIVAAGGRPRAALGAASAALFLLWLLLLRTA